MGVGGWVGGWVGGGGGRPSSLEAFCKGLEGATQRFIMGLSWGDVDSCKDIPQYKVMKYLVFWIILTSLLRSICTRSTGDH